MWKSLVLFGLLLAGAVNSENSTLADTCDPWDAGPFSALLEDWATADIAPLRHGRVMALPPTKGYYVTERIDMPLVPPPPPHGPARPIPLQSPNYGNGNPQMYNGPTNYNGPQNHNGPQGYSGQQNYNGAQNYNGPHGYKEWETSPPGNGKIVNKPNKFRPSYQQGSTVAPVAAPAADRVDEPPRKQVTETDLYLLSAIEKLVYRADLMEKRLRRVEESLHLLVAGTEAKPEPCDANYTMVGGLCSWVSREAADWKGASVACRRRAAHLLELPPARAVATRAALLADRNLKGKDFWTGGLNPGLLWIWSHSAKPVEASNTTSIVGDGRCLALVYDPALNNYVYRGQDCTLKHQFICQKEEDKTKLSNEIERAARKLKFDRSRKSKLLWDDVNIDAI